MTATTTPRAPPVPCCHGIEDLVTCLCRFRAEMARAPCRARRGATRRASLSAGRSGHSGRTAGTTAGSSGRTSDSVRACRPGPRPPGAGRRALRPPRSSAAAFSIVTPPTPGYWRANQRSIDATRPASSASSRDESRSRPASSRNWSRWRWSRSPATARASTPRISAPSGSIGALASFHVSSSPSCRPRSRRCRSTTASRPRIGCSDSTASQCSCAHSRVATRCHAASAASRSRGSSTPRSPSRGPIRASSTMR